MPINDGWLALTLPSYYLLIGGKLSIEKELLNLFSRSKNRYSQDMRKEFPKKKGNP
jgi:hypothetical protein